MVARLKIFNALDFMIVMAGLNTKMLSKNLILAAPACPVPFKVAQNNGQEIEVILRGDEKARWLEDLDGHTLMKNEQGDYVYAISKGDRKLVPSTYIAGQSDGIKKDLPKRLRPEKSNHWDFQQRNRRLVSITEGTVKNLVIPFVFMDHLDRALPSREDLDLLFNSPGGHPTWANSANMSVKEYFQANSYGKLTLESDVIDWIQLNRTEAEVTQGQSGVDTYDVQLNFIEALHEVLEAADKVVDFTDYDEDRDGFIDAVAFVHSGYGAEWGSVDLYGTDMDNRLWSHKGAFFEECLYYGYATYCNAEFESEEGISIVDYHVSSALHDRDSTDIMTIATVSHETLHFFGLPDLYDIDGSSGGIGSWGIMSNSYGWQNNGLYPPHMSAWSKHNLSWADAVYLGVEDQDTVEVSASANSATVYIIEENFADGEYLMIENRQPIGLEMDMPQGGLVIWHIASDMMRHDLWNNYEGYEGQNGWPENGNHYAVAVVQADGDFDLELYQNLGDSGDVFHANGGDKLSSKGQPNTCGYLSGSVNSTGISIKDISQSGLVMTFTLRYNNITDDDCQSFETLAPTISSAFLMTPILAISMEFVFLISIFLFGSYI